MIDSKRIRRALFALGFRPLSSGTGGHEIWEDSQRRRVKPALRKKEIHEGSLYALGVQLEGLGVCTKNDLRQAIRRAS